MRLSERALTQLPPEVTRPGYDRRVVRPGIVHLGIGAFHRAHQAVYTEAALARDPRFVGAVERAFSTLDEAGTRGFLSHFERS